MDAFDQGRYADAIDLLTRAQSLVHAPTHLLYIARAHAELGQLVRAREVYLDLTREKLPEDAPRVFKDAAKSGEQELNQIEAKLPYVSVVVQGAGAKDVRVTRDGVRLPQALLGIPHPVDPGEHTFQAFADGMESAPSTVPIKAGSKETVVLTLQAVETAPSPLGAAPSSGAGAEPARGSLTSDAGQIDTGGVSGLRIGAYVGFGVAAVGAVAGTIFIINSGSTRDEADDLYQRCAPDCTDVQTVAEVEDLDGTADSQRNLAVASYIVGGLGLAGGITLLLLDSSGEQAENTTGVRPVVGLGYAGLSGRF